MNARNSYSKTVCRILPLFLVLGLLSPLLLGPTHPAHAAGPYVVNLTSDGPDSNLADGICYEGVNGCSLRAAIQQASADGVATSITFADGLAGSTLLVEGTYGTIIWAGSNITLDGESKNISISGQNLSAGQSILQIQGNSNLVRNLTFRNAPQDGIQVGDFAGVGYGDDNVIEAVTLLANGASGIYVYGSTGGGTGNVIRSSGIGAPVGTAICGSGNTGDGIHVDQLAHDTDIYGNTIACNGGNGILIDGQGGSPTGVTIHSNWVGTTSTTGMGNGGAGIWVVQTAGTQIDSNTAVSNGTDGIALTGTTAATVTNNLVGFLASATPLPNGWCGVTIIDGGSGNRVGGTAPADRNVISGNSWSGVCLEGGSTGNIVDGNYIGTDIAGAVAIPNQEAGVYIKGASNNNSIGSSSLGAVQLISGNAREGIYVENSTGTLIGQSNFIGIGADGVTALGNGLSGILLSGASDSFVAPSAVVNNGGAGVAVTGATAGGNKIGPADVGSNGGLPIDLGDDGPTANDAGDGDTGPNGLLNYPEITGGSGNTASGTVCNSCTVHIYEASGNPRAAGGGGLFVMETVADGSGNWSATLPSGLTAADITTVACESPCGMTANTSEMSPRWGITYHEVFLPLVVVAR